MSTTSTPMLNRLADSWEKDCGFNSAVCSGIVGDLAHKQRGGYHISIMDQPSNNYSVIRPDDKAPPGKWSRSSASAIDMNLSRSDMLKCNARLVALWKNRKTDPRAKYLNAFNGWDGSGKPQRYNFVTGTVEDASEDHTWHVHLEIRRRYANDDNAYQGILTALQGSNDQSANGEDMYTLADYQQAAFLAFDQAMTGILNATTGDVKDANGTERNIRNGFAKGIRFGNEGDPTLNAMKTALTQLATDEAARATADAARDAATLATVQGVLNLLKTTPAGGAITQAQLDALSTTILQKIAEANDDAIAGVQHKLDQVAEALDNAGAALSKANDEAAKS